MCVRVCVAVCDTSTVTVQVDPLPFDRERLLSVLSRRQEVSAEARRRPHITPSSSGLSGPAASARQRQQLDADIASVLHGRVPRAYGELPAAMGNYTRIAPASPAFERVSKIKAAHLRPRASRLPPPP